MHLVKAGLIQRFEEDLKTASVDRIIEDHSWWFGYTMGLLESGLLTQNEHDELASWMPEKFDERWRKGR